MAFCYFLMTYRRKHSRSPNGTPTAAPLSTSGRIIADPKRAGATASPSAKQLVSSAPIETQITNQPEVVTTPAAPEPAIPPVGLNRRSSFARSNSSPLLPKKEDGTGGGKNRKDKNKEKEKDKEKEKESRDTHTRHPSTPTKAPLKEPPSPRGAQTPATKRLAVSCVIIRSYLKLIIYYFKIEFNAGHYASAAESKFR